MIKAFTFGGDTGEEPEVYCFITKELVDNKFGTANPIPFRVVDCRNIGLDIDVSVAVMGILIRLSIRSALYKCVEIFRQQYDREEI